MAQHDFVISNQGFPAFRSDLNDFLSAVKTTHSGTSRPSGAAAGTIWLDTTSATTPTLKYYDGADDISLATIDHSANTVNWLDSTVSITGLTTTATGTVLTLSDSASTSTVNLIIDNQKEVRFRELTANGTNYVGLKAPASLSTDTTFTLPSADGTNGQALITNGSGTLSFSTISTSLATPLAVVGDATAGSEIRLPEDTDNGSNYVALKAANSIASNVTFTLPSADGSANQVLQTNGSGVLSFASVSSVVKKIHSFTFSTRTAGNASANTDQLTLTASFTPLDAVNNDLQVLCAIPVKSGSNDFIGVGLRFTGNSTSTNYDNFGKGVLRGDTHSDQANTHNLLAFSFVISANTMTNQTYTIKLRTESANSQDAYYCPNSTDDVRLATQTTATLIITEFAN